jgi:hypothetical protein
MKKFPNLEILMRNRGKRKGVSGRAPRGVRVFKLKKGRGFVMNKNLKENACGPDCMRRKE